MVKRLREVWRLLLIAVGLVLAAIGAVGVFLPTHLLGVFLVLGVILMLRNSYAWRRRFIRFQRRHPRFGHPLRRLLRGEVWPVLWHEALRTERLLPHSWRRLRRWRTGRRRGRRAVPG